MRRIVTPADMQAWTAEQRAAGRVVGFVPTLGCLHEGHAALVRQAVAENDVVVVSAFVNPIQFRPEKHAVYPRDLDADQALATREGARVLFAPEWPAMYPGVPDLDVLYRCQDLPESTRPADEFGTERPWGDDAPALVRTPASLALRMDGKLHPWHFDGVCTVVALLYDAVRPDRVYYGEKDPQQVAILRRLTRWHSPGIDLRTVPTVRDPDGLASSSRNTQLAPADRPRAVAAAHALRDAALSIESGAASPAAARTSLRDALAALDIEVDYADVLDPDTLDPIDAIPASGEVLLFIAYLVDGLRLADTRTVRLRGEA